LLALSSHRLLQAFAVLLILIVVSSCGGDDFGSSGKKGRPLGPAGNELENALQPALACKQGTRLTYENYGSAFMTRYCSSCHSDQIAGKERGGAPVAANFDNHVDIKTWRSRIYVQAVAGTAMPPFNLLSPDERKVFGEWIKCGAP
jgi:cytochrome c5